VNLVTLPGVFRPISDSWMLAEAVAREGLAPGARTLDLCTGSGVAAIAAAQAGADASAVDRSLRALVATSLNASRNGCEVRVHRGHLFGPVNGERFDLISANPPYVPHPDPRPPRRGAARAWQAGLDGRLVLDEICAGAATHLRPGGVLLLVHSSLVDERSTIERLERTGLVVSVPERHRGPLGPLMAAQQRTGLLPPEVEDEDVVVIRAVAPES
jgi:release factor glutamine methyltransferase